MNANRLFPTEGPVLPEERQIGRRAAIEALQRALFAREQHTLLLEPRRTGKTSVGRAVLARVRDAGGWALEIDLSESRFAEESELPVVLAAQARTAGIKLDVPGGVRRSLGRVKNATRGLAPSVIRLAASLGVNGDAVSLATAVDQVLGSVDASNPVPLGSVLLALDVTARAADRPVIVFVDECQRLGAWPTAQRELAAAMQRDGCRLVLLFAGSEESALSELFAPRQPLHRDGLRYPLPRIAYDEWSVALRERFGEIGCAIGHEQISEILQASDEHPQRTMQVCAHVQAICEDVGVTTVDGPIVSAAVENARAQPSWNS